MFVVPPMNAFPLMLAPPTTLNAPELIPVADVVENIVVVPPIIAFVATDKPPELTKDADVVEVAFVVW